MQEVNAMQLALADQKKMLEECTLSVDVVAIADGRTKHVIHICVAKNYWLLDARSGLLTIEVCTKIGHLPSVFEVLQRNLQDPALYWTEGSLPCPMLHAEREWYSFEKQQNIYKQCAPCRFGCELWGKYVPAILWKAVNRTYAFACWFHDSPPARWGLLDFITVVLLLLLLG